MPVQVQPVVKEKDPISSLLPLAGSILGGIFGGPAGAAAGGAVGNAVSSGDGSGPSPVVPTSEASPLDRRMQSIENNPATQLQKGLQALDAADMDTQQKVRPVLEEALKRSQQNQANYGSIA